MEIIFACGKNLELLLRNIACPCAVASCSTFAHEKVKAE